MSPHINTFRERIRVNSSMVSQENAVEVVEDIFDKVVRIVIQCISLFISNNGIHLSLSQDEFQLDLTYFEVLFLASLLHFQREGVKYAVIEAGIGGEGDATNIVKPLVSVITNVQLDHMVTQFFHQIISQMQYVIYPQS